MTTEKIQVDSDVVRHNSAREKKKQLPYFGQGTTDSCSERLCCRVAAMGMRQNEALTQRRSELLETLDGI